MRVRMTRASQRDVALGARVYEKSQATLGDYFVATLRAQIARLSVFGGVHMKTADGFHRMPTRRFPFLVYYVIRNETAIVVAVMDCRKHPRRHASTLRSRRRMAE